MSHREIERKRVVIPIQGIPISEHMREAALLVFGPDPPVVKTFIDNVLQIECERIDREIMEGRTLNCGD